MRQVLAWLTAVAPLLATVVDGTAVPQAEREAEKEALAPEICVCVLLESASSSSCCLPNQHVHVPADASTH